MSLALHRVRRTLPRMLQDRQIVVTELRDLLGKAVAEERGLSYSHWELPQLTVCPVPKKIEPNGVTRITIPSVSATVQSVCYDPEKGAEGEPQRIPWPREYGAALLSAQRWAKGDGAFPSLPARVVELLPLAGPELRTVAAEVSALQTYNAAHETAPRMMRR